MDFKKAETLKSKGKKILKQPSIVNFFDQETQQKFMKKHYSTPIKNNSNSSFTSDKTPLSPIENVIYPSPVVNLNAIEKNRDFYSMEEFLEDMNTTAFKKALFTVEERFENYSTDEKFDALKKSTNQTIKKVTKARESYHWLDNKKSDSDMETTDTESYTSNFDSDESVRDSDKLDFEDVPRNMENLENFPKNMENLEVTKLLLKKAKQRTLRTSRLPNEIQTVSQVCPILFRDPPKQDLRHALQDLGITKPFSRYTFNRCLEDFGAEMVSNYFKDVNVKTNNLKSCFYCGYQTESSLVMGSHLDKKHKQMFKKWPFSDRLDVKPVY